MAKKKPAAEEQPKINKSAAIRQYAAEHPGEKPKAIAEALSKQLGQEITAQVVSTTLSNARKAAGENGSAKGKQNKTTPSAAGGYEGIIAASKFIAAAGGLDEARKALDAAGRVIDAAGSKPF